MLRLLGLSLAIGATVIVARTAHAQVYQTYYVGPPAAYYAPTPVTTYYAPARTTVYYAPPVTTVYRRPLLGGTISGWRYNYPATTYVYPAPAYPTTAAYYPVW